MSPSQCSRGQFVKDFDAVAVRVVDVDRVGHAVVDAQVELDAPGLEEGNLLEPGVAIGVVNGEVVETGPARSH